MSHDLPRGRSAGRGHSAELSRAEAAAGWLALVVLPVLLLGGVVVGTHPYRIALADPARLPWATVVGYSLLVLTCYSYSNILGLCYVASFLGALGRRVRMSGITEDGPWRNNRNEYFGAILRGVFVYAILLLGLAGWMTYRGKPYINPDQQEYILVAGSAMLASFCLGRSQSAFRLSYRTLLRRLLLYVDALDLDEPGRDSRNAEHSASARRPCPPATDAPLAVEARAMRPEAPAGN